MDTVLSLLQLLVHELYFDFKFVYFRSVVIGSADQSFLVVSSGLHVLLISFLHVVLSFQVHLDVSIQLYNHGFLLFDCFMRNL